MSNPRPVEKKIFILAGEDSGDLIGGRLMKAMRQITPPTVTLKFIGIGGETMTAQGLQSQFPMKELSHFGFFAIFPHLPKLYRRLKETVARIKAEQPDLVITIDAPAFCLRVSARLSSSKILRIHYVAPQHWAWLPHRARALRHETDLLLALLPFEPSFFADYGVRCKFVGHPVVESRAAAQTPVSAEGFRHRHQIERAVPLLTVLPGSRTSEFMRHMPIFAAVIRLLFAQIPDLRVVLAITARHLQEGLHERLLESLTADFDQRLEIIAADNGEHEDERFAAFAASDAALAVSGTVTLELALTHTPAVVAYRLDRLRWWLAERLIRVPRGALSNIVGGREIVPELLQDRASPDRIAQQLIPLLLHQASYIEQKHYLVEVAERLTT
ncbi:MAG: lipid-A-disaccharide synthase, partial [Alphaproteobacteria bacterium]|nr:lipid-A-disaccharide synthase [Alphaproteobacteria bacterium]